MIRTEVFGGYGASNDLLDKRLNEIGRDAIVFLNVSLDGFGNTSAVLVWEEKEGESPAGD